jgi:DNA modification methylase
VPEWSIVEGDCREVMAGMEPWSVDAIVTDPPYGIGFMGREWDTFDPDRVAARVQSRSRKGTVRVSERWPTKVGTVQGGTHVSYDESADGNARFGAWVREWAAAAAQLLRPGGHIVVFGGPRTFHRVACGLEDAGFEIRDVLCWLFGQGFPKSKDLGSGWGTGLKPGWEPIILARAPLAGRTVTGNHAQFGTGGLNVDGCRLDWQDEADEREAKHKNRHADFGSGPRENEIFGEDRKPRGADDNYDAAGRWPPNVAIDAEAAAMLDAQAGERQGGARPARRLNGSMFDHSDPIDYGIRVETPRGGASRFFYCPKADRAERNAGLDALDEKPLLWSSGRQSPGTFQADGTHRAARNHHPTVKPIALMRWLCRLVTPAGGLVLDPFAGSGTTGIAALAEGFRFAGVEREAEYVEIARLRIEAGAA